ncbi:hypothetical protein KR054_011423 [Drosophila jambulina]|nr:hypothetical protein KR054_011423 [Drosophila jambulina]
MLASKYFILIAALACCLSGVLAVSCEADPTDPDCIDCSTDTTDSVDCTTTTSTVAPTSSSTSTVAPVAATATTKKAGTKKKVTIRNLQFRATRKVRIVNRSG